MKIKNILTVSRDTYLELMSGHDNRDWRIIPGFPNYEIMPLGLVRNKKTNRYLRIASRQTKEGYGWGSVRLRDGKREYHKSLRTLISTIFGEDDV